jgi:hypothetical protein
MMGSTPPSQSTLSDLKVLLELLQAASDPKQAKKVIDSIADARKQYDDVVAKSQAATLDAVNAKASAEKSIIESLGAAADADERGAKADAKAAKAKEAEVEAKSAKQEAIDAKTELRVQEQAFAEARQAHANAVAVAHDEAAKSRVAISEGYEVLGAKLAEAEALKAEYEAKLAKFKALAE